MPVNPLPMRSHREERRVMPLSQKNMCIRLGVSNNTLMRWRRRNDFPVQPRQAKFGNKILFRDEDEQIIRAWRDDTSEPGEPIDPKFEAALLGAGTSPHADVQALTISTPIAPPADEEYIPTDEDREGEFSYPEEIVEEKHINYFDDQYNKAIGAGQSTDDAWETARKLTDALFGLHPYL